MAMQRKKQNRQSVIMTWMDFVIREKTAKIYTSFIPSHIRKLEKELQPLVLLGMKFRGHAKEEAKPTTSNNDMDGLCNQEKKETLKNILALYLLTFVN